MPYAFPTFYEIFPELRKTGWFWSQSSKLLWIEPAIPV